MPGEEKRRGRPGRPATATTAPLRLLVIGAGMAAHRLVTTLSQRGAPEWSVTVIGEEPHFPYDRVSLSSVVVSPQTADLTLPGGRGAARWHLGDGATTVDSGSRTVATASGRQWAYDALVFATGSRPFVPPIHGADAIGCFTFRTLADVSALHRHAARARRGVVIGGGLLGLEAAGALQSLGVSVTVVEAADRLLPLQVDEGGGAILRRIIANRGITVVTGEQAQRIDMRRGRVRAVLLASGSIPADVVVFAVGVRPRDDLAAAAGVRVAERGGIAVDQSCRTNVPDIFAIGECARLRGEIPGLLAPSYQMAETVAAVLMGETAEVPSFDRSTKLKLLGVDVASFGDALSQDKGTLDVVLSDPASDRYRKLVLTDDALTLRGGILVGAAGDYAELRARVGGPVVGDVTAIAAGLADQGGVVSESATVCSCHNVTASTISEAIRNGSHDIPAIKSQTGAATGCGSCLPLVRRLLDQELEARGVAPDRSICEHLCLTRAELFELVAAANLTTFSEIISRHGTGRGCAICKPVVASILASQGKGHVLDPEHAHLQDTNDRALANLQRDGSYSVVPRIPGGEVTPTKLRVIADVATKYDLYTKITGGQRIALFGARLEQLPHIWEELGAAGFESGHAYGKAVRAVKSCVGSTWCRFGVRDSVGMAIDLELRYRGMRAPHKVKLGVSGCARECAEARGKDIGAIATERGWNLYVGGNAGFEPRHARLLAEDVNDADLVRLIDRLLIYYVRTGDRLQRTSAWLESLEGGLDQLRRIVVDEEGLAAELEAEMARHVASYSDEWRAALADQARLEQFSSFANAPDQPDPDLRYERIRDQKQPPTARDKARYPAQTGTRTP